MTLFTIFASSIKNARTILSDIYYQELGLERKRGDAPRLHTLSTPAPAVCPLDGFQTLGDGSVFSWSEGNDLYQATHSAPVHAYPPMQTYTRELHSAVTALRSCTGLLLVLVHELPTGGLDDLSAVGGRVVGCALPEGHSLGHFSVTRGRPSVPVRWRPRAQAEGNKRGDGMADCRSSLKDRKTKLTSTGIEEVGMREVVDGVNDFVLTRCG